MQLWMYESWILLFNGVCNWPCIGARLKVFRPRNETLASEYPVVQGRISGCVGCRMTLASASELFAALFALWTEFAQLLSLNSSKMCGLWSWKCRRLKIGRYLAKIWTKVVRLAILGHPACARDFDLPSPRFCLISMYCILSCFIAGKLSYVVYYGLYLPGTVLHFSGLYGLHCISSHCNFACSRVNTQVPVYSKTFSSVQSVACCT